MSKWSFTSPTLPTPNVVPKTTLICGVMWSPPPPRKSKGLAKPCWFASTKNKPNTKSQSRFRAMDLHCPWEQVSLRTFTTGKSVQDQGCRNKGKRIRTHESNQAGEGQCETITDMVGFTTHPVTSSTGRLASRK